MVTAVNSRDLALAGTSPRIVPIALPTNLTIDFTGVTGTTKPANNATSNTIYKQSTAPTTSIDGDIWVDTGTTPNTIRTKVSGSWVAAATYVTSTSNITDGAGLGGTATWTGVTGAGRPDDYATVNRVTRSVTAPTTPAPLNGDIWIDTSTTPNIIKMRIGGSWTSSASLVTDTAQVTDGAQLGLTATWAGVTGTGRPANYADVTTAILGASGTSIVMTNSNLFKSASGVAGVFIGSGGVLGKNSAGTTTFAIDGATGAATFSGTLSAVTGNFGALTANGPLVVSSSGSVSNGIGYGGTGFFLGYSSSAYKFSVGDNLTYLRWDGTTLVFTGALSAATGSFSGSLNAATGTFAGSLSAATGTFAGSLSAATGTFSGTVSASNVVGGTFSGASIAITGTSGAMLISGPGLPYTSIGNLIGSGYIEATNSSAARPAVRGQSSYNTLGVHGSVAGGAGQGSAHGVRGENSYNGATGIVGGANGYDFYADGSGTNYGPFTGSHDALLPKGVNFEVGDIVCDIGVAVRKNVSNTICTVTLSAYRNQQSAIGVIAKEPRSLLVNDSLPAALRDKMTTVQPDGIQVTTIIPVREVADLSLTHDCVAINALGEGQLNVCGEGGDLLAGDLVTTSSMAGKGMRQSGDLVRSSTVAKCREAVSFEFPEQVKLVACIYLCG